ncbi:MAG: isoprenylcysteine carboxylmethyltransferase family protein [Roseitalea porphyridii]|uniref:methyltransferase family protein n=1 Tax=Roseitalea porphyridii TaxID=1852022 RepID=UPI0032EE19E5
MQQKSLWVKIGDFFFRYRNAVFPVILVVLFLGFAPPAQYFDRENLEEWKDLAAVCITLSGLAFRAAVIGFAYIKRGGLNKRVYADDLVTEGFFGVCRNPLYVGNMLIYAGVFLTHGDPYVVVIGIASYYFIYESIIAAEEFFLRGKFGAGYAAYCRDVPRWLPDWRQIKHATAGMDFNVKRVVMKDYTTAANAAMALLLLQLLESYYAEPAAEFSRQATYSLVVLAVILGATGAIALAKRRKWLRL